MRSHSPSQRPRSDLFSRAVSDRKARFLAAASGLLWPGPQQPLPRSSPGLASSTSNIYTQSDVKSVHIYENQRWNPVTGYTSR